MKSVLIHEPTGQLVDLAGVVSAETFAWLESLQGSTPRRDPVLRCGACRGVLYLRHDRNSRDRLHGVHYVATTCRDLVIARAVMSDEHKRQAEYHVLAAQAAGLEAATEVITGGSTRVDVVVDGRVGIEIQRSGLTLSAARSRTRRSMSSGLDIIGWFTDRPVAPVWFGKVPSYRTEIRSWGQLPKLGTVRIIGPQIIEAARCTHENFQKCPRGQKHPCGKYHETYRPWAMLADDLVARLATGDIVAAATGKHVRLVSRSGLHLYEELTGTKALYGGSPAAPRGVQPRSERVECGRPIQAGWFVPSKECTQLELDFRPPRPVITLVRDRSHCDVPRCEAPGQLYPGGFRCDQHKPRPYLSAR